ncbi:acyl-CoA carboxylase subunit epsilon [Streptomyces sp. NPDC059909]|uniref:acyl-CoA carboxylase subunit epsilon n=1 Tax=Streptomyces sp. NPDC059909 TaxID=3346998 RepID=UPI0036659F06
MRIVHGKPDDTELAALLAVLTVIAFRREAALAAASERRTRRAHWDRAWGGGFQPSTSWRVRDKALVAFDPGAR